MNLKRIWIVFRKEITNAIRDRRTLYATVLFPLVLMPALVLLPIVLAGKQEKKIQERPSRIAIINGDVFKELTEHFKSNDKFVLVEPGQPEESIRSGEADCIVEMKSGLGTQKTAQVVLLFDRTKRESEGAANKVKLAINKFSNKVIAARLKDLKLDPAILMPVKLEEKNVATEREMGGFFLGLVVGMMAVIGTISGGMVLAIDATAGEKERKTLEVLLASPASRNELVLGKFLGVVAMALSSMILMTLSFTVSFTFGMSLLAEPEVEGALTLAISGSVLPLLFLSLLMLAAFVAALEIAISVLARSFREAQTYLTPLTFAAVIPVIFMQVVPADPPDWIFYVPLLNTMLLIRELLMGIAKTPHLINTLFSSFIYAVLGLRLAFRIFRKESVLMR